MYGGGSGGEKRIYLKTFGKIGNDNNNPK